MAIVARRTIQRLLNENRSFASTRQRQAQADALNRRVPSSIAVECEVLILNALSKSCTIKQEPPIGSKRPDLLATVDNESFVADIATVFRDGPDDLNPIEAFSGELRRRAMKLGLSGSGFQIDARGAMEGQPKKQRMKLKLPRISEFPQLFAKHVDPFIRQVAGDPSGARTVEIKTDSTDVSLGYTPGRTSTGRSYPAYDVNYSKTHNTIFNTLKSKANQLRGTSFQGPRGVILCGAGADLTRRQARFGMEEITDEFFRQHKSVTFALALWVPQRSGGVLKWHVDLYENQNSVYPVGPATRSALAGIAAHLPPPVDDSANAVHHVDFWRWKNGLYFHGFRKESRRMVAISGRVLLEYLAGRIDYAEFLRATGFDPGAKSTFERRLERGELLVDVNVHREAHADDDIVEFVFGEPDGSIGDIKPS